MPIYKDKIKKDGLNRYKVKINYTDKDGNHKQRMKIAYGLAEARQLEAQMLDDVESTDQMLAGNITIEALSDKFFASMEKKVRESTINKKISRYRSGIQPYLANEKINALNVEALEKWEQTLLSKGYELRTLQSFYSELRQLLNYAVKLEYIPRNVLLSVGNFRIADSQFKNSHDKLQYYTAEQFKLYIAEAKKQAEKTQDIQDYGYFVFYAISFYMGTRKGETNALKWSDIEGNKMHIRRSISQKVKGGDKETPPKNKSSYRTITIPDALASILAEHKSRQESLSCFTDDFRICGAVKPLRDTSLANRNHLYAVRAGLPTIRIHDFRHSHASLLANAGINIQEVARRLGHSNVKETWNTYAHLYPKEEDRALSVLNGIKID